MGWGDTDRAKALGYRAHNSKRCSGCGTFPDEWLDDKGRVLHDAPYEAELVSCYGCRAIDEVQQQQGVKDDPGLRARLTMPD